MLECLRGFIVGHFRRLISCQIWSEIGGVSVPSLILIVLGRK